MTEGDECDLLVIGGGPAGTTAAALLSQRDWRVILLERGHHPRFHIGESLLPMNLPIFQELGILDQVAALGVHKPGADFTAPEEGATPHSFTFDRALRNSPPHAYQVRRDQFDQLLFENCIAKGVTALQGTCAKSVTLNENGRHRVTVEHPDGSITAIVCKYLIDASGQQTLLASQQKWRVRNKNHASAAMFAHFSGIQQNPGDRQGNISIYWIPAGWIWMIPLPDGNTSVGAVCRPEYLKKRTTRQEDFLLATVRQSAAAAKRMSTAKFASDVQVAANYSYYSTQQTGPGFALVGDAFAFIDPVFSSGVYLAMSSASSVVPVAEAWLTNKRLAYRFRARRYERKIRKGISMFSWFIYRFNTPTMTNLFRNPRNILGVEQAVTSMLAGDVYKGGMVRLRIMIFKLIFAMSARFGPREIERKIEATQT